MLKENIIHDDCIKKLLYNNDEESLESLCGFMKTVGKRLDKPESAIRMDSYFDRLKKLTQKKDKICARIRFMIQDVIDLRQVLIVKGLLINYVYLLSFKRRFIFMSSLIECLGTKKG